MPNLIEMENINKTFGTLRANADVCFRCGSEEIVTLLGENGAGKSTLMKILYGLYKPESGTICIQGKPVHIKTPTDAIQAGIAMVHQHFMLVEAFTVAENILLGAEEKSGRIRFNKSKANQLVDELCEASGLKVDPEALIEDLPLGMRQRVEILKALYRGAKVLILDEPTAVLSKRDIDDLFEFLKKLKKLGLSTILITHKLDEAMRISDRIVVMRQGEIVARKEKNETNVRELSRLMVGRELKGNVPKEDITSERTICQLKNLNSTGVGYLKDLKEVNLEIHSGEIVGLAGIDGNGQDELVEIILGLNPLEQGSIMLEELDITQMNILERLGLGIGVIPADRGQQGLVSDLSIKDNLYIGRQRESIFSKGPFLKTKNIERYTKELFDEYNVRAEDFDIPAGSLSGGNQQKVVLGREFNMPGLKLIIACQPTRGLDIGAIEFTHNRLLRLRNEGKAILLISADLEEIMKLSDRVAVIYNGEILADKPKGEMTLEEIGLKMGGVAS